MRTRVKICCMASPDEARMAAEAGADLIGLVGPMPSGAGVVSRETCREIAQAAPAWVTPVLLTSSERPEEIVSDIDHAGVRAVQVVRHLDPSVLAAIARARPGVRRFQVVHVEGPESLGLIDAYAGWADAFLLDSGRPAAGELGGTGRTHDWSVSAEFVRRAARPVFLAGGLSPANAARAIAEVRPFGLDICSGVRTDGRLDADKLRAFMSAIHSAG